MEISRDKGFQKAAQLLLLLGKEEATEVLRHLSEKEVEGITREIASIDRLESREGARILEEFGYRLADRPPENQEARGGPERARQILEAALGKSQAEAVLARVSSLAAPPFAFLEDLDLEQVKLLIKDESVPIIATILVHLQPARAAKILIGLPPEWQKQLVRRIAALRKLDPEVIRRTEEALREKVRAQGRIVTREVDGRATLAEILKHMDLAAERDILGRLKEADADLAREVEDRVYSPQLLLQIADRDLQDVLKQFSEEEIALLLKGLDPLQKEKILSNISSRRREMIQAEHDALGPVRRSKVDRARREFLDYLRLQEEQGAIAFSRREETLSL